MKLLCIGATIACVLGTIALIGAAISTGRPIIFGLAGIEVICAIGMGFSAYLTK